MLSSNGGFSYQGFDIDSISDITGVSINKMNYVGHGSQHSGSFGSDNTDALLNASLRDFEDESLLESVSQVGGDIGLIKSSQDRTSSHVEKQQISLAENTNADIRPEGFSVHVGTSKVSYGHNGIPEVFSTSQNKPGTNFHDIQDSTSSRSFEETKNLKDYGQGFSSKVRSTVNLKNEASYVQRRVSSDSDITLSGRDSVIKHHSSLPNVHHESVANGNNSNKKESPYVNGEGQSRENEPRLWGQSGSTGDSTQNIRDISDHNGTIMLDPYTHDHQDMSGYGRRNTGDFYGYSGTMRDITGESRHEYDGHSGHGKEKIRDFHGHSGTMRDITGESRHEYDGHSGHGRGNIRDFHGDSGIMRDIPGESRTQYEEHSDSSFQKFGGEHAADISERNIHNRNGYYKNSASGGRRQEETSGSKDHLQESFGEQMILGLKHDPETNEVYDDKVREGADLLSKILGLGGDHNVSSTSHSSRSSERNEKLKSREKGSLNKHRSRDSSMHSEQRLPRSSSPKNSISRSSENNVKLKASSSRDHIPLRHHRSLDSSLNTEVRFHENLSTKRYEERPSRDDSRSYVNARESRDARSVTQSSQRHEAGTLERDSSKYISHSQEEPRVANLVQENGLKEYNFLENGYPVPKSDIARSEGLDTCAVPNDDTTLKKQFEVKTFDELPRSQAANFKQLELDIEEVLTRKKMAMQELQMLEDSLQRNKADMKSSESLVEQYRWQATQARSELMDLEKKRSQLQEECISLDAALKKSKQKETFNSDEVTFGRSKDEIFKALQEREQLKQDLDSTQGTLKRELGKAKTAQDDLRGKIRNLEAELGKQHDENVKNLQIMKEQVDKEREKVRTLQQDKLNAMNKIHDQMKEQQDKENETLKTRMLRERKSHIEILEEKLKRETNQWKRATQNAELRVKQLEEALLERNDELNKVRVQFREEKQKNLDIEKQWRAQLESERQDADIKHDGQERSWKDREEKFFHQQKELENLVEERTTDFRRSEERCRSQTEELQKIIENKNEEIKMIRGLVRQQEDATRVLGERLRNEAREHVRNAVEKERQSLHKDKERIKRGIDEEKEKHARIVKQMTEQLDIEKERHSQTKDILNKLKQEGDDLRKQLVEVHGERISSAQRARQENGEELGKIKEKLHEFTAQADKLEKIDQETAKAIYEECRKIAEMVDMPLSFKTPTRFSDEPSLNHNDGVRESPTKEALASLRHCNDELRHRLSDMKKQMTKQSTRTDDINETSLLSTSENELTTELRKHLAEKEEEIQRLQRKYSEEIQMLKEEKKKEQLSYRRTIAKLEQEFQKLVTAKTSSTSYKTKRDQISRSTVTSSNSGGTHPQSPNVSPASRSVEKSSSADLLKHLQDRVKKLRAENENLKKSSDNESLVKNTRNVKGFNNSESVRLQSNGLTISQLRTPTKSSGMNENIEQVSRIQKLLASSTKEDTTFGQSSTD